MEAITAAIASAIATQILPEAFKEGGKALGKGVSETITKLITAIRDKFKAAGREGILTDFQQEQTEDNQSEFETVLKKLMKKDTDFAEKLKKLVEKYEIAGGQKIFSGVEVEGDIKAEDITQESKANPSQEIFTNVKAKNIEVKNISQKN